MSILRVKKYNNNPAIPVLKVKDVMEILCIK